MSEAPEKIWLGSASPRRRELLAQLGVICEVRISDIDESVLPGETGAEYVLRLAEAKARAVAADLPEGHEPVLAADTSVCVGADILGKPADEAAAVGMLAKLSGRTHTVATAVAVLHGLTCRTAVNETSVTFRAVSPDEAAAYWATGEPADKAGGYGIQGFGAVFIESIDGSYSGVMGLPLFETARLLEDVGYRVLNRAAKRG